VTYEIIWTEEAESRLAEVWMAASDRNAVTNSAYELEVALEMLPLSAGEPVYDSVRQFGDAILSMEFEVVEQDRCVYVMSVWSTKAGKPDLTGN
jgi:hypothetical protein